MLYYRVNNLVYLETGKDYSFILGNVFLSILINNKNEINIQIELENDQTKKYKFNQDQTPINIGRVNSDVLIQNSSISKKHGIIEYNSNNFYYRDLGSINGTTLIIKRDDYLKIKGDMFFKLDDIPFKIHEVQ